MPEPDTNRKNKIGRYLSVAIGVVSAALGIVIDLFTEQVREMILSEWARTVVRITILLVIFIGACLATWLLSERLGDRRRQQLAVEARTMDIRAEDLDDDLPDDHAVIGRQLHYLERRTNSPYLAVFLPGLGLDAGDFRRHMRTADEHTVAITLFGFNVEEAHSDRYRPIGLRAHTALIQMALTWLRHKYPEKALILVGFSVGADLILRLSEDWQAHPDKAPAIKGVVLLDPNIDQTTMNISTAVAAMDTSDPLAELRRLVHQAKNMPELQNISEYLRKITLKNLDQVRQHARDILEYCNDEKSPERFLQRVEVLGSRTEVLRVWFSFDYETQFNSMRAAARAKGLAGSVFNVTQLNHFQLIDDELLPAEFKRLTARPARARTPNRTAGAG